MHKIMAQPDGSPTGSTLKNVLFAVTVSATFVLGFYLLFLAYANAGVELPVNTAGLIRTAAPADFDQINIALGNYLQQDFVFVVLDTAKTGLDPEVENATKIAARSLADDGMAVAVRILGLGDPDFSIVADQNRIDRFPAVLAVKRDGGIVLVSDEINAKNLLHAYYGVWGKSSSCDDALSDVY